MRRIVLAIAFALLAGTAAQAQRFDSGWRRIAVNDLADLDLWGGDVRVNNLIVAAENETNARAQPEKLATHVFSLSAVKRAPGSRNVFVQLVGMNADRIPTMTSIIAVNFGDSDINRLRTDTHRFIAFPKEVATTREYFVRILVQ
ncbi:hypothetical protein [Paracraurococcus lichenis]|uniref:Uncharacterized protein n=1 Tax=Paracraurococcus lichenis TaxID=3064888 RepID=A0ABT9E5C3_9PROT|nr:hypothetical protein [Paracraurococcus sp. LOR1-02]MDO9711364.1 hypothetical protein [Paracraurococcus sp. LOR1-02]